MAKFDNLTIGIFHYGDQAVLQETIKRAEKWTDNIHLATIDLLPSSIKNKYEWNVLIEKGYSEVWNRMFNECKTRYMYILGAGKQIDRIDEKYFNKDFDSFACVNTQQQEKDAKTGHKWFKVGKVGKAQWRGKVHEEISLANLDIMYQPTFYWSRFKVPQATNEIAYVYRWFSRVKWLYNMQVLGTDRQGTNAGWWTHPDKLLTEKQKELYIQHKYALESKQVFLQQAPKIYQLLTE